MAGLRTCLQGWSSKPVFFKLHRTDIAGVECNRVRLCQSSHAAASSLAWCRVAKRWPCRRSVIDCMHRLRSMKASSLGCLCKVGRCLLQNARIRLHARQLGAQSGNLHLLGTHALAACATELALPIGLDPVEQHLFRSAQSVFCHRHAVSTLDQPVRFVLELQRASRFRHLRHFRSPCLV